jgi:hypothetical protein
VVITENRSIRIRRERQKKEENPINYVLMNWLLLRIVPLEERKVETFICRLSSS